MATGVGATSAGYSVSWPKTASRVPTTITEDVIREEGLPVGWVDVGSGLKLVVRKELRAVSK